MTEPVPRFIVQPIRYEAEAFNEGYTMELVKKFWLLWTALGAVVLGFITLAAGMLTIGPIMLVLGYCVLLPFFLWRSFQESVGE